MAGAPSSGAPPPPPPPPPPSSSSRGYGSSRSGAVRQQDERFMGIVLKRNTVGAADMHPPVSSIERDYLCLANDHVLLRALHKHGDERVLFADTVAKVNRHNRLVPRILVLTDAAISIFECETFRLKRRILLRNVESLHSSELADHFLGVMVPDESDLLLVSTRKSEIIPALVDATKENTRRELDVKFGNSFMFAIDPQTHRQVEFVKSSYGVSTRITNIGGDD